MTDLAPERTTYGTEDRRWLRDIHGLTDTIGATLNGDLFPPAAFPDGVIPSGTVLARVTTTNLWGPYDPNFDADPVAAGVQTDGRNVARGHLLDTTQIAPARRVSVAVMDHGAVLRNFMPGPALLPTTAGRLDAAAETALSRVRYTNG